MLTLAYARVSTCSAWGLLCAGRHRQTRWQRPTSLRCGRWEHRRFPETQIDSAASRREVTGFAAPGTFRLSPSQDYRLPPVRAAKHAGGSKAINSLPIPAGRSPHVPAESRDRGTSRLGRKNSRIWDVASSFDGVPWSGLDHPKPTGKRVCPCHPLLCPPTPNTCAHKHVRHRIAHVYASAGMVPVGKIFRKLRIFSLIDYEFFRNLPI
jgi:hypothetical protein